jgi:choice-of-anchor A domain-containing protein
MKALILVAMGAVFGSSVSAADLTVKEVLSQYNAVTSGNLNSSQEVEGRVFVNGDLTGNNINVGFVQPLPAGTDALVVVNGQTTIGRISGQNGNVYLNDANGVSTGIEKQGSGPFNVYVNGSYNGNDNFKAVHANQGDLSSKVPQIDFDSVSKYSTYLAGLSGASSNASSFNVLNNAVQSEGAGWDASKVTVYNTTMDDLRNNAFKTNLVANSGESMIINVSGKSGTFMLNPDSGMSMSGQILWNFYEATDITVDRKIIGSVLAPNATMSGFSGSTEGSVLAKTINLTNGELHLQTFKVDLPSIPTNVPEIGAQGAAGALALVLGSIAVMSGRRRRFV